MKTVFVTGGFDLLHAGHVKFLTHAAELGNKLIVAISSDEYIRYKKGENRPIYPYHHRSTMVKAVKGVDVVHKLNGSTDVEIGNSIESWIKMYHPDVVCCGWDGAADQFMLSLAKSYGFVYCRIYAEGIHTSETIRRIQDEKVHTEPTETT